uniref:Putative ATP-dependent helicase n=1 Tax=Aegilops tauschii TaxID=37682 RepID=M8CF09_AEGTA
MGEADLEEVLLSWTAQEISDDDLYRDKRLVAHDICPLGSTRAVVRCLLCATKLGQLDAPNDEMMLAVASSSPFHSKNYLDNTWCKLKWLLGDDGRVETIPCNFKSLNHYLTSYRVPLIEETRSDLCSCLELISEAPSSKILSMEVAGKPGSYFMDVDFWDNDAGFSTGAYSARNGDIYILSSVKPEAAEDLNRHGVTYCLAMVTEVSMDDEYQKGFRVKVAKNNCLEEEDLNKLKHAIFLNNITTNTRIWKALTFDTHMNENFAVIKLLLAPTNLGEDVCRMCAKQDGGCLASYTEQLLSVKLNQSQLDAIESIISAVRCGHVNRVKLIWGPPGTGKTKTNLKDFNEHIDNICLPSSLGDILLFGNRSNMDITEDLQEVFLDFRVDELVECFSSLSGWNYRIASMISFFEDSASRYDMLLEDDGKIDPVCFLDFIKKQFDATAIALKRCIMNLWVHLPGRCFSRDSVINISSLLNMLENFGTLLCNVDLTEEGLKTGLGYLSTENSVCAQPISSVEKELDGARSSCLKLLKDLLHSLNLPTGVGKDWVQSYCIRNATLLFCTASSSYRLHHMEIAPLDVLIVDEAAQVRECELVIPLRLHWLKHVVLVGDDCQLSAMVKSKVCKEAGFETSLFGRLVMLKFDKHLLNIQYRMNPCISLFPNTQFYGRKILDGSNVLSPSYNKDYTCLPFGSYTFINVTDGREDKEGTGNSRRNMVEVAVVLHLIHTIFKSWKRTDQGLSIGVVSPYKAQVDAIKSRLGKKYDTCDGFHVRVKSVDGFQGEEDDIIILSTVRSNGRGVVGFLADNQRTNVALTRARHCLWIVGNAHTLYKSGTEWTDLVADAERRKCVFSATNDATMCKLVVQVKQELDELDDLLNADSAVFSNTRWKVILSDEFRKSFTKLKSPQLRKEVLQKLIRLGDGWRTTVKNIDIPGASHLAKIYKVRNLYLVWSTDVEKTEGRKLEVPMVWHIEHDIIRYNKDCKADAHEEHDLVDTSYAMENSKVSESFLLMKFYSLSSGVAKHLLTATDGSEIDIPFELTDEEQEIIQFPLTSFILGRSGTGKTTVLTMKLIQKEQRSLIASQGLHLGDDLSGLDHKNIMPLKDAGESSVKQVFITVSPKLCSAIKNHISGLKRFGTGDISGQPSILHMHDIMDDLDEFTEIPDNFCDLPHEHYPLTITYHLTKKFAASTVFTEIISHIKGAYQASRPCTGKLGRQDYVMLSDKRFSSLNNEKRDKIYDIFLEYESMKCTAKEFDLSDFVNSLHSSLVSEGYHGDMVDFVYIDEVQDLTMTQIALLKYVCMNIKEGFLFAGDTAQTIARGIDFRFEDIRSLFYTAFLAETEASNQGLKHGKKVHLSDMFQLSQNFRTHCGILRMAQSIMSLLYFFFPSSVDKLNPETGLVYGEAPVLLESDNDENVIMTIFGESKTKHGNLHGFGAEQVILVRDDAAKKQIIDLVGKQALVLTIVECKGLEFQAMQTGSSSDDWRLRGTKLFYAHKFFVRRVMARTYLQLFNEGQFEMATMCFEKAGDAHREKLARAAGLVATANRVISTNLELGKASLQTASEIYESIGMHEKAATCYIKLGDYKKAGMVYMQKCGTSKLEDAGDCFAMAECWSEAAEVFLKAKCYTKCFSMCSKGKKLFNLGLQFLQQLEEEHSLENSKSLEVSAIRTKYLDNCAQHYFERGDIKHMMPFVKAFSSMDYVRAFLNSRNLVDELLSLEMEMGNFLEAAGIAKHNGDVLLEVDMLEKAGLFEDATRLLLLHIIVDSLWSSNSRGWPPKRYAEKEQLLSKAKEMAEKSRASGYNIELGPGSEDENSCNDMLASNQMSPQTLFYVWNNWKSIIIKVLSQLCHADGPELNDYAVMYEDLCAKYFGLRKDGEADRYVVLNVNASWLSTAGRNSLQQDGNRCFLGAPQCYSCAQCFWMNELSSVGFSVLKKLEAIVQISPKSSSSYTLVRTILIINEIAKFLEEPQFSMPKSSMKLRSFFVLCGRRFFELVFLVWRDGTTRSLLRLLDSPAAYGLIADSLNSNLRPANKNLTHGHLGRTTMLLLHAAQLDEALLSRLLQYLDNSSDWAEFFQYFKRFLDSGGDRSSLISNFKRSLEFTFNVKWKDELDYISPICYVGLMECLGFMASSCLIQNDFICCTKSLLVNMLECRTSKVYIDTCLVSNSSPDSDLDRLAYTSGRFIYQTIMAILTSKHMLQEWVHKTSCPSSTSYKPVLLRLVVTLYPLILTLSLGNCYEVTHNLLRNEVFKDLPVEFSQKIVHALQIKSRTPSNFTRVLADALAAIGDNMVVIGTPKSPVDCQNLNAYMISKEDLYDVPKIMALLCPEEASYVKQETPLPEKSDGNKSGNVISGNIPKDAQDNEMERSSEMDLADEILFEKLETLRAEGLKNPRDIIELLVSALPWLESNTPAGIDKRLLDDVRRICSEFENGSDRVRGRAFLAVEKLRQGENKLQLILRVLTEASLRRIESEATKKSMNDWSSDAAVQPQADADRCSDDDEPDTGEAGASTSKKAAQKQKSKKKSKKSKGRGKK